jgi:lipase chaperone LimK
MNTSAKLLRLAALAAVIGGALTVMLAGHEAPVAPVRRAEPDYFAFVRSMEGTRPDGEIRQAAGDKLVVDAELAYLFDYYLAGLGEKPLEAIRAEIIRELDRRLSGAQALEARRLLDAYLAYKRALVDLERGLAPAADAVQRARQRLTAMQQLRRTYFSEEEIAGLFAASDAYDLDAVARLEIDGDAGLTAEQRKQRRAALDVKLPQKLRDERDAPTKVLRLEDAVVKARAQGAGDNEIYRMRAAALSPAAAARLADIDREEIDWQRRIGAYQAQRQQLLQASQLDQAALQQLRDAGFSADEQKRLGAYEQP